MKRVEFLLLGLYTLAICVSWEWGVKALVLLSIFLIPKLIWQRRVGNPALDKAGRWVLGLMMGLFGLYALSLGYSANLAEGGNELGKLLPFLLLPLYFLLSDTSYLSWNQIRTLLYLFLFALVVRFFIRAGIGGYEVATGARTFNKLTCSFDPMHHAYLAMYTLLGFTIVYNELTYHRHSLPRWLRACLVAAGGIMLIYTYMIQSRAGLFIALALLGALALQQLREWKHARAGMLTLVGLLVLFIGLMFLPGNRLGTSVSEVSKGDNSDVRFEIWGNAIEVATHNLPFGVGLGDRMDALEASYPAAEDSLSQSQLKREHIYNPHNQYLDTALATGIPGELVLLAILLIPCLLCLLPKRRPAQARYLLPLMIIVVLSCPFESIFERQMGLLYFAYFYCLFHTKPSESAWTPFAPKNT